MKKYFVLGLLLILSIATAQVTPSPWVDVGFDQSDFDYSSYSWLSWGLEVEDGETQRVEFRTKDLYLNSNSMWMKITPYPNSTAPDPTATLTLSCPSTAGTLNLNYVDNWVGDGWFFDYIELAPGVWDQTIRTGLDEEAQIDSSMICNLTANNQDLFVNFYAVIEGSSSLTCPDCNRYSIPNEALGGVVGRVESTVLAVFDLFDMSLMVVGFLIVLFVIVMIYKVFMHFANKGRPQ
jgi:hypothetical protein